MNKLGVFLQKAILIFFFCLFGCSDRTIIEVPVNQVVIQIAKNGQIKDEVLIGGGSYPINSNQRVIFFNSAQSRVSLDFQVKFNDPSWR